MEEELVPNNVTLAGLRGLLRIARKNVPEKEVVCVELALWHFDGPPTGTGAIREEIGIWKSGTGEGTSHFSSIKEAREYIEGWKEEEDAARTRKNSNDS